MVPGGLSGQDSSDGADRARRDSWRGIRMIQGFNPRTGQPAGEPVAETTDTEVDAAAEAARAAWPVWDAQGPAERAGALEAVAEALDARVDELAAIADTETALGDGRLRGEVARTTGQLRLFSGVLRDGGYADVAVSPATATAPDLRRISHPVGPVAVFAASNFPFAYSVAGGDTASALAAGCPVIVKAHENHPHTSELTGRIVAGALEKAGAPAGVFAVVHGFDAGIRLLRHPAIAAAGFTGSTRGGLELARICAEREVPIPFYGEMGSVNPVVVLPGAAAARAKEIASGYADSLVLGAGQFCTNPGLLFVPDDAGLLSAIADAVRAVRGGPMLSERIHQAYERALHEAATPEAFTCGLAAFAADIGALSAERFGPAGIVITYPSVDELLPVLGRLGGNLAGCVHADTGSASDMAAARRVIDVFERITGRIVCNGWPTGVAVTAAQHHGGPWPATTAPAYTSVGSAAIRRWLVPVAYQNMPPELLPDALRTV